MRARSPRDLLRALLLGLVLFTYVLLMRGLWRGVPSSVAYIQGVVVLAVCLWWARKVAKRQRLPQSPVAWPLAALVGSAALSTLLSVDPRLSFPGLLEALTPVLGFYVVCDLLLAGWPAATFVDALLILTSILLGQGLLATAQWYWAWWQMRVPEYPPFLVPFRLYEVGDHPNLLAPLLNLALPFAILRLAQARGRLQRLAYGAWLGAATIILFYTRSRGGWVASSVVVAMALAWLLFQRRPARLTDLAGWARRTGRVWLATAAYLALFAALFALDAHLSPSEYSTSGGSAMQLASRPVFWRIAWQDFWAHPLAGSGPLTYAVAFVNAHGAVRGFLAPHAHNVFLHTLAEQGLVGLSALGWLLAASAVALLGGLRTVAKEDCGAGDGRCELLVGACAGLAGLLAHGQVEVPTWLPANALLAMMLLALGLHAAGAVCQRADGASRWRLAWLAVPLVLLYVLGRQDAGQAAMARGIDAAAKGDWPAAARALDEAVAIDPTLAFYHAQRGYAYGVLADPLTEGGDPSALGEALQSYALALRSGPRYVPDLLNAAWLYERAGSAQEADRLLEEAVQRGRDWALPALLLGERHASQGRVAEAERLFALAFAREPQARDMAACLRSAACREAAVRNPAGVTAVSAAHERAQRLLAEGQPADALAALQSVPVTSAHPLPWLDRADAYIRLGQYAQARYALQVANIVGADTLAHNALSLAAYHRAKGSSERAIDDLEGLVRPQRDLVPYSAVFHRFGLPGQLVPSLDLLQRTGEDLAVYRRLAQLYAEAGRSAGAAWAEGRARALAGLLGGENGAQ